MAAASVRLTALSLARMFDTWTLAVLAEMNSSAAMSRLLRPAATRRRTSISRAVRPRAPGGCPPDGTEGRLRRGPQPSRSLPLHHRAIRLEHEVALIPGAWLTADVGRVGRADSDEPGFGQYFLGSPRHITIARRLAVSCVGRGRGLPRSLRVFVLRFSTRSPGRCPGLRARLVPRRNRCCVAG